MLDSKYLPFDGKERRELKQDRIARLAKTIPTLTPPVW